MAKAKGVRRDILISKSITDECVQEVIEKIMNINYSDSQLEEDYGDKYEREPIRLFINSFGGSVYDGMALVDTMLYSKTPVHTISLGSSMSIGLDIFMAGHKRFISQNTTLMYHEIGGRVYGQLEGMKLSLEEYERLGKIGDSFITSKTKVTQEMLDDYKKRKAEWYISSEEAIRLGFGEKYQ